MTITGTQIVARVNYLLNDISNVQWTEAEKLAWINEGRRVMATIEPTVFGAGTEVEHVAVAGCKQRITTSGAYRIASVDSNVSTGEALYPVDASQLDAFRPGWRADSGAVAQNWFPDATDPLAFWIYPAITAGLKLKAHVHITPTDLAALSDTALPFDQYEPSLVNYVCYRCLAKDGEASNETKAAAYFQLFTSALKGGA